MRLNSCVGWCFSCDGLRNIEDLSLDDHLAVVRRISRSLGSATSRWRWFATTWECQSFHALDEGLSNSREIDAENFRKMARQLEEATTYIEYLSLRKSEPKCLTCSSENVERLTRQETEDFWGGWNHPVCGGTLVQSILGSMNLIASATRLVYGPDGGFSCEEPESPCELLSKFTHQED